MSIQELVVRGFSEKDVINKYKNLARKGIWKSEEKLFNKYFKKNSKILDIGCGAGRTTFQLAKMGYNVIGIDITPAMIKVAKELNKEFKMKIDFRVGNAINLKFKNESFDNALFSFNGWDQVPRENRRLKVLKEVYKVLKSGGYFIFTSHVRELNRWVLFWLKQWIKFYILKRFGFRIKELEYGDRFFKESMNEKYEKEQFIHIPKLSEVKESIKKSGFELVFYNKKNTIVKKDTELKSGNYTFFVCRKPS